MENNIGRETSLWELLKDTKVEIPIIQRDYAQGREGKHELRSKFLDSIIDSLSESKELVLDFVYGTEIGINSDKKLNPLDGQQRLTTLFLLHWYLDWKLGKLDKHSEESKRLLNFTYETRVSSREFCKALVGKGSAIIDITGDNKGLSKSIENQSWFFKEYLQDPTISSMLRMLDDIDEKLKKNDLHILENFWKNLTEEKNEKITFFYLDLKGFKQTDDLYVKMNARGKALTPFENFKADLVGYIRKVEENYEEFKGLKLSSNIDNAWTDVFWKNKNENSEKYGEIDDVYFAFLNRFFLNEIICFKTTTPENEYKYTAKDLKKGLTENDNFDFSSDTNKNLDKSLHILSQKELNFYDFKYYSSFLNKDRLYRLNKILLNLKKINDYTIFKPTWDENFDFIPRYIKDEDKEKNDNKEITPITQPQRVLFYAISKYLEKDDFDNEKFKQWLRVVSNIVENADIDGVEAMIGHIRLIDELSENASDIYNYLAKSNSLENIKSKASVEQLIEEANKAEKISEDYVWEEKIIKAEKTAFFKGAIRFLFTSKDENKDININWALFDERLVKSEEYFDKDGLREKYSASFISGFIKSIDDWWSFFNKELFDWKASRLKKNILDPLYLTSTSKCLDCEKLEDIENVKFKDSGENKIKEEILNKDLIEYIINKMRDSRLYGYDSSYDAIYKRKAQNNVIVLHALQSNKKTTLVDRIGILNNNKCNIEIKNKVAVENKYYLGWDIEFEYNKQHLFLWGSNGVLKFLGAKDNNEKKEIILENITEENFIKTVDKAISGKEN